MNRQLQSVHRVDTSWGLMAIKENGLGDWSSDDEVAAAVVAAVAEVTMCDRTRYWSRHFAVVVVVAAQNMT